MTISLEKSTAGIFSTEPAEVECCFHSVSHCPAPRTTSCRAALMPLNAPLASERIGRGCAPWAFKQPNRDTNSRPAANGRTVFIRNSLNQRLSPFKRQFQLLFAAIPPRRDGRMSSWRPSEIQVELERGVSHSAACLQPRVAPDHSTALWLASPLRLGMRV